MGFVWEKILFTPCWLKKLKIIEPESVFVRVKNFNPKFLIID